MSKTINSAALALGVSIACGAALADQIETVDGVVRGMNVSDGYGTLTIFHDDSDGLRTYEVTPDTEITVRPDPDSVLPLSAYPDYEKVSDLRAGDEVTLKVREADGRWFVVGYNRAEVAPDVEVQVTEYTPTEPADADTDLEVDMEVDTDTAANREIVYVDASYDSLPRTATALPMVALGAGLALVTGLGLRARRRKS